MRWVGLDEICRHEITLNKLRLNEMVRDEIGLDGMQLDETC